MSRWRPVAGRIGGALVLVLIAVPFGIGAAVLVAAEDYGTAFGPGGMALVLLWLAWRVVSGKGIPLPDDDDGAPTE